LTFSGHQDIVLGDTYVEYVNGVEFGEYYCINGKNVNSSQTFIAPFYLATCIYMLSPTDNKTTTPVIYDYGYDSCGPKAKNSYATATVCDYYP